MEMFCTRPNWRKAISGMLVIDVLYKRKWSDFDWTPYKFDVIKGIRNFDWMDKIMWYKIIICNDNVISTFRIDSDTPVNPLPLIVISRNFNGNCPAISLRKSVAETVL